VERGRGSWIECRLKNVWIRRLMDLHRLRHPRKFHSLQPNATPSFLILTSGLSAPWSSAETITPLSSLRGISRNRFADLEGKAGPHNMSWLSIPLVHRHVHQKLGGTTAYQTRCNLGTLEHAGARSLTGSKSGLPEQGVSYISWESNGRSYCTSFLRHHMTDCNHSSSPSLLGWSI